MQKGVILLLILFSLFFSSIAQTFSSNDFKLYLDTIACSDTAARLNKQQLLNAKEVTANFPWLQIKSLTISITHSCTMFNNAKVYHIGSSYITKDVEKIFETLIKGDFLTIEIDGYNQQKKHIPWSSLNITIVN